MDTKERRRRAAPRQPETPQRRRPQTSRKRRPANANIVYTDPKPFSGKRFLLKLATVLAVVLAVVFGLSIFFKVEYVNVSGTVKYTPWEIKQAAGLREGDNLLSLSDAQISGRITTNLPYVQKVRVGIKLPNTVNIEITESEVIYSVEASDGTWWLINADGKTVDETTVDQARGYAQILGVQIEVPALSEAVTASTSQPGEDAQSNAETSTQETTAPATTAPVATQSSEQLAAALSIAKALEENHLTNQIASINVANLSAVELWYGQRYQVALGDTSELSYKISMMKAAIDQMGVHQGGQLDVSFQNWSDKVGYTPFA